MIIEFAQVNENDNGFFKATNVVSKHDVHVTQEMFGDWYGTVEWIDEDGWLEGIESDAFPTFEEAAIWCEKQNITLTTTFGA